jgi:hypothetical protein
MAEARAHYFEHNGIPADGGHSRRWVKVTRNRLPLYPLNTAPRSERLPVAGGVPRASAVDVLIFGMAAVSGLATLLSLIIFLPVLLAVGLLLP